MPRNVTLASLTHTIQAPLFYTISGCLSHRHLGGIRQSKDGLGGLQKVTQGFQISRSEPRTAWIFRISDSHPLEGIFQLVQILGAIKAAHGRDDARP